MLSPIMPAYVQGSSGAPSVRAADYPNGQTFLQGAVLVASSNQYQEAGATPTANIAGVALQPYNGAPGYQMANSPTVVTGRRQAVSMAVATRSTVFKSVIVNNSAVPIAPVLADNLTKYGLKSYSGVWVVDKSITGASACVQIVEIDTTNNLVYWKFLEAALATP